TDFPSASSSHRLLSIFLPSSEAFLLLNIAPKAAGTGATDEAEVEVEVEVELDLCSLAPAARQSLTSAPFPLSCFTNFLLFLTFFFFLYFTFLSFMMCFGLATSWGTGVEDDVALWPNSERR